MFNKFIDLSVMFFFIYFVWNVHDPEVVNVVIYWVVVYLNLCFIKEFFDLSINLNKPKHITLILILITIMLLMQFNYLHVHILFLISEKYRLLDVWVHCYATDCDLLRYGVFIWCFVRVFMVLVVFGWAGLRILGLV